MNVFNVNRSENNSASNESNIHINNVTQQNSLKRKRKDRKKGTKYMKSMNYINNKLNSMYAIIYVPTYFNLWVSVWIFHTSEKIVASSLHVCLANQYFIKVFSNYYVGIICSNNHLSLIIAEKQ